MFGNYHFPLRLNVLVVVTIVIVYYKHRQYLEEISPYDMYARTKKEVAHTVQPIMLKLHTKFQDISMDSSQVLVNENLCVHNTKIQSQKSGQQEVDV
jgi:hypothetical protein